MAKVADLLTNPAAVATPLVAIVVDRLGTEAFNWEAEVLEEELQKIAGGPIPGGNLDSIHALILSLTTERFWQDPKTFMLVCNALSDQDPVVPGVFSPPFPDEIAWAVTELVINDPLENQESLEERFSSDVLTVITSILYVAGFLIPPEPLTFVKPRELRSIIQEDDPAMYQGIWDLQNSKRDLVEGFVANRALILFNQLKELDLKTGSTEDLTDAVSSLLGGS